MESQLHPMRHNQRRRAFTLRDGVAIAFRRRRLAVLCFFATLAAALLAIVLTPAEYESQMEIIVDTRRVDPVVTSEANVTQVARKLAQDDVTTEMQLLQSRDLLQKVVLACRLQDRDPWWVSPLQGARNTLYRVLGASDDPDKRIFSATLQLQQNLKVSPVTGSHIIRAVYASPFPERSLCVLQNLADAYLEKHQAVHRPAGTHEFFTHETERYKKRLAEAEARLVAFNREVGFTSADFEKQAALLKIGEFEGMLSRTRSEIAEVEQRAHNLERQASRTSARITTQVRTEDSTQLLQGLRTTLFNLELKRTELLGKFEPTYRAVQDVEEQIAQTRAAIAEAEKAPFRQVTTDLNPTHNWLDQELVRCRSTLVGLQARAAAVSNAIRGYRARALLLDQKGKEQQELLRRAKAEEANYLLYLQKQEEARITEALDQKRIVNVAITEPPQLPLLPTGLPLSGKLLLALVIAVMVGAGSAFLAEYIDGSFRTPDELEDALKVPVLAALPMDK